MRSYNITTTTAKARDALNFFNATEHLIGIGGTDELTTFPSELATTLESIAKFVVPDLVALIQPDVTGLEIVNGVRYTEVAALDQNIDYLAANQVNRVLVRATVPHVDLVDFKLAGLFSLCTNGGVGQVVDPGDVTLGELTNVTYYHPIREMEAGLNITFKFVRVFS